MIGWFYLDKTRAALAALRDYSAMKNILATTPQAVKEAYEADPGGADKATLKQRYQQAREFMDWFEPAWRYLSATERQVLREFYLRDSLRSGATARLQVNLGYSERYVDKIRGRALDKLAKQLYGG